jgi:hypothetical protein
VINYSNQRFALRGLEPKYQVMYENILSGLKQCFSHFIKYIYINQILGFARSYLI